MTVVLLLKRGNMRKTASSLEISRSSMHRIFKNDLRLTAYKKQSRVTFRGFQAKTSRQEQKDIGAIIAIDL